MRYRLVAVHTIVGDKKQITSVNLLIKDAKKRAGQIIRKPSWPSNHVIVIEK